MQMNIWYKGRSKHWTTTI